MKGEVTAEEVIATLVNVSNAIPRQIAKAFKDSCIDIVAEAKVNCTPGISPFSGMRFKTKPLGTDGAPFITGNLRRSNQYRNPVIDWRGNAATIDAIVYNDAVDENNASYAEYVHEGTSKMQARPFLKLAIDTRQDATTQRILEAVDAAMKEATK